MRRLLSVLVAPCVLLVTAGAQVTAPPPSGLSAPLLQELRRGGLFLYFRHFDTEGSDDAEPNLSDCRTQRNLSAMGRERAWATGRALEALKIPVGLTLAGQYCRNRDSGVLLTGRVNVLAGLNSIYFRNPTEPNRVLTMNNLRALLNTPPRAGTNTVIAGHENNLRLFTGWMLAEGEAAVLRPDGKGGFAVLARVTPEQFGAAARGGR